MNKTNWHTVDISEVVHALKTDPKKGLDPEEARKRQEEHGPNVIKETKKISPVMVFLEQFNDFMIWVLIVAALISGLLLGEIVDAVVIAIILFLNAILGFVQTYRAEKSLEALKALSAPIATVIRGKEQEIKAEDLVPGDLILLSSGDIVPADARLIEVASFQTLEAPLTGESTPVGKELEALKDENVPVAERKNMVFSGTTVGRGRGAAIVVSTARQTEMGKIADLIETKEEPTPLQKELKNVGFKIALAIIVIAIIVFVVGILKGNPLATMFLIAVALAVAAIPEGLPAIVTITLAVGVQNMARENAIVRRLHAVETLGSTNYIASDKTGTLTLNEMTAINFYLDGSLFKIEDGTLLDPTGKTEPASLEKLMQTAVLANDSRPSPEGEDYIGEPTELALVRAGHFFGYKKGELDNKYKRINEIPFESERKEMTTLNRYDERFVGFTKGAIEVLLEQSDFLLENGQTRPLTKDEKEKILSEANEEAATGYRMLGFAYKEFENSPDTQELEKNLTFVGMIGLVDPPRPEVAEAIALAKDAGVNIAMVTGDHLLTANKIATEVGLKEGKGSLSGKELEQLSSHELAAKVEDISVFARVDPIHKVKIVEALKEKGYIVAVTGDGVNDAPALKKADIGIAMGITGTDVSKEASSMVLADDNFATIIKAIWQGRVIFDNLRKFISFLLSANVSEVLTIFLGILLFPSGLTLLLPIQILWINLVTDAFPALALGVNPAAPDIMKRKPRTRTERILGTDQAKRIVTDGLLLTVAAFGVGSLALWWLGLAEIKIQTLVFTTLVLVQLIHAFNYSSDRTIFSADSFRNKWLLLAFAGSLLLQLIVIYIPFLQPIFKTVALNGSDWILILVATFSVEIVIDILKTRVFSK